MPTQNAGDFLGDQDVCGVYVVLIEDGKKMLRNVCTRAFPQSHHDF